MEFLDEIPSSMSEEERRRYAIVLLDSYKRVPGLIISANAVTGKIEMKDEYAKETKRLELGPRAIRIMRVR